MLPARISARSKLHGCTIFDFVQCFIFPQAISSCSMCPSCEQSPIRENANTTNAKSEEAPSLKYSCGICFSEIHANPGGRYGSGVNQTCSHYYCNNCMNEYMKSKMNSGWGDESELWCPSPGCNMPVNTKHVKSCTKEQYQRVLKQKTKEIAFSRTCPSCGSRNTGNPNKSHVTCVKCRTKFALSAMVSMAASESAQINSTFPFSR